MWYGMGFYGIPMVWIVVIKTIVCLTDYILQTVVIRLCRNFRDCFGGVLVFVVTKTKRGLSQGHPTTIFGKYLFGRQFEI